MSLNDQRWITLRGDPITGRAPTQLVIMNDVPMTPEQYAGVQKAVRSFFEAIAVTPHPNGYHLHRRELSDGTRIRMESNLGVRKVMVWPTGKGEGGGRTELADLFFCVPGPFRHTGYTPFDPKFSAAWKFEGKTLPPTKLRKLRRQTDAPNIRQHPGYLTWWNPELKLLKKPAILSWFGRASRYGRLEYYERAQQRCVSDTEHRYIYGRTDRAGWLQHAFKSAVWLNGVRHDVRAAGNIPVRVMSAGLKRETPDGPLQLFVVTPEVGGSPAWASGPAKPAIYRGVIEPYSAKPVIVEKLFVVDFTITTDMAGIPYDAKWETLLQPLYFNASCTALASIVTVDRYTTYNTAAAATLAAGTSGDWAGNLHARLMTVDVATQATAFSGDHVSKTTTSVATGDANDSLHTTGSGSQNYSLSTSQISYGAVDFVGDVLKIILIKNTSTRGYTKAWTVETYADDDVGSAAVDATFTCRTQLEIYEASAPTILLAQRDSGTVAIGELHTTSSRWLAQDVDTGQYYTTGEGSGYETQNISAELLWHATIEGGDIRLGYLTVAEYLEVGTSTHHVSLSPYPYHYSAPGGIVSAFGFGPARGPDDYSNTAGYAYTVVSADRQRKPACRLSAWKDGAMLAQSGIVEDVAGTWSLFGVRTNITGWPGGYTAFIDWYEQHVKPPIPANNWVATLPKSDAIRGLYDWASSGTERSSSTPEYSVGLLHSNAFAATPDGKYVFLSLGGGMRSDSAAAAPTEATKFIIDGVMHDAAVGDYIDGDRPTLPAPIFLYNVPLDNK